MAKIKLGKGASVVIAAAIATMAFPLEIVVTNCVARDLSLPEVPGLFLAHAAAQDGSEVTVTVTDESQLVRLGSTVEQISELNGYEVMLEIEPVAEVPAKPAKAKPAKAGTEE